MGPFSAAAKYVLRAFMAVSTPHPPPVLIINLTCVASRMETLVSPRQRAADSRKAEITQEATFDLAK